MCTDISGVPSGLAMWLSLDVFEWLNSSPFDGQWHHAGIHVSPPGKQPIADDQNFAFGQGPDILTSERLACHNKITSSNTVDHK